MHISSDWYKSPSFWVSCISVFVAIIAVSWTIRMDTVRDRRISLEEERKLALEANRQVLKQIAESVVAPATDRTIQTLRLEIRDVQASVEQHRSLPHYDSRNDLAVLKERVARLEESIRRMDARFDRLELMIERSIAISSQVLLQSTTSRWCVDIAELDDGADSFLFHSELNMSRDLTSAAAYPIVSVDP